jgi:antagonist of KipI
VSHIEVLRPGLLTTVQDSGRVGYQKYGVVPSGVMDPLSARIANLLVGNSENSAVLEFTLQGPSLRFHCDVCLAVCGAEFSVRIGKERVSMWRPVNVRRGSVLEITHVNRGARGYLAVLGGFDVPKVMGSHSTYLAAAIGGYNGRSLRVGDMLAIGLKHQDVLPALPTKVLFQATDWSVDTAIHPYFSQHRPRLRVIAGGEADWFAEETIRSFYSSTYSVTVNSNRMGYRLEGPPLIAQQVSSLLSEGVTMGTIQVPADGQPIVLMADHQTTGGYAKLATVITADYPVAAQLKPGDQIQFTEVSIAEAQSSLRASLNRQRQLAVAIRLQRQG